MNEYKSLTEFYPTPPELIARMLKDIDLQKIKSILEPSAGKGDIMMFIAAAMDCVTDGWVRKKYIEKGIERSLISEKIVQEFVLKKYKEYLENGFEHYYGDKFHRIMECIESDVTLQSVLKGRDFNVIDDDFLEFDGDKHYDLIIMNPPFSNGDRHLLQAIKIAKKTGSQIVCILNAETIRNPYSNIRKELLKQLDEYEATYEYVENAFTDSERATDVEVVIVRVNIPSPFKNYSRIWEELEDEEIELNTPESMEELVTSDYMKQAILMYKREIVAGQRLIEEYFALKPHLTSTFETKDTPSYMKGSTLYLCTDTKSNELDFNDYVYSVRYKYWYELLHKPAFMGNLTSNLQNEYFKNIREYAKKDFSLKNIYKVKLDILKNVSQGIKDKIVSLFEQLSYEHSMDCEKNIHYFNGWKSNSAFKINSKVVIPYANCWDGIFKRFSYSYELCGFLEDIEKCLDFLDGGETTDGINMSSWLTYYENNQITKNLHFKYFDINVYKKGTVHIKFTNEDLLKKFNIYGCLHKGWLPPSYGKKTYTEMNDEEKSVIDEFEGEASYTEVFNNRERFIVSPEKDVLMLSA